MSAISTCRVRWVVFFISCVIRGAVTLFAQFHDLAATF